MKQTFFWGFFLALIGSISFGVVFANELRQAEKKMDTLPTVFEEMTRKPTLIMSANGEVLYRAMNEFRKPVTLSEVPKTVINATLAAEDKRFYEHRGIDYVAMGRVLFYGGRRGGGSTLTMQIAKRVYTSPEVSFKRKMRDMALAVMIEKHRTKDQILELYLNQVYYGAGAYGIRAAAEVYFGKTLEQLTIPEAALLARCVRRPSDENPFANLDVAVANRNTVLAIMRDEDMISQAEYSEFIAERVKLRPRTFGSGARIFQSPYFVQYVLDTVKRDFPDIDLAGGGYRIETTINTEIDRYAQKSVQKLVDRYRRRKVTTAAFALVDRRGQIKAMAGGYDFRRNQYNVIYQGQRQPGSSFKPIVYATALSRGVISPNDYISNEKFTWKDPATGKVWAPKNSGGGYGGSYSVRSALAFSKNVPAVRVCDAVGPATVVAYAHDVFGIDSKLDPVLSLALGSSAVSPLEMAQAYSVFQTGGNRVRPFGILRIVGPDGNVVKDYQPEIAENVLDPRVCEEMDGFLRAVVTSGTGKEAQGVVGARGKTGTTQDNRDAWFCGYTGNLIGIGWIANEYFDEKRKRWLYDPMPRVFGGTVTVELWVDVMKKAQDIFGTGEQLLRKPTKVETAPRDLPDEEPIDDVNPDDEPMPGAPTNNQDAQPDVQPEVVPNEPPDTVPPDPQPEEQGDVVSVEICAETNRRATIYCPETVTRRFPKGSAPGRTCTRHGG